MNKTRRTEKFLRTLSSHLSGRSECKHLPYRCVIGVEDPERKQIDILDILGRDINSYISFYPIVYVYKDRHARKSAQKSSVLDHVLKYHFADVINNKDIMGNTTIHSGLLVPGIYEYQLSITGKRRKWIRVE